MHQIPMLTTVAQNQTTCLSEFSDPPRRLVRATIVHVGISRSFFLQCMYIVQCLKKCAATEIFADFGHLEI
jgi:hypothetical protein